MRNLPGFRGRGLRAIAILNLATMGFAQSPEISITNPPPVPVVGPILKPFQLQRRIVSPVTLTNTPRLESLVRAGNLYLSVQDVIALVLENNIDIAIQRYGPLLAREVLRRAEGGGFLRSVGVPIYPGPSSVSLAGVSANAVGLSESGRRRLGRRHRHSDWTPPPNLDPYYFAYGNFAHNTTPLSNTFLSDVNSLQNNNITFQTGYGQSFITGTSGQLTYTTYRSSLNSPANSLNPYTAGSLDLYITQNLLQGSSRAVNNRNIRVAKNNMKVTDLQVRLQVITTVSAVLNLYWDLVSFNEALRIQQQALETAEKLLDDNKKQVALGTLPAIEVTRASAEVSRQREPAHRADQRGPAGNGPEERVEPERGGESLARRCAYHPAGSHCGAGKGRAATDRANCAAGAATVAPKSSRRRSISRAALVNLGGTKTRCYPASRPSRNSPITVERADQCLVRTASGSAARPYLVGGYSNCSRRYSAAISQLYGGFLAEHSVPQPRGARPITLPISSLCGKPNCNCSGPSTRCAWM